MSTELASIRNEIKNAVASINATLHPITGRNIKIAGKSFVTPDGKVHTGPMKVVVVDYVNMNRYFVGQYNPNAIKGAKCYAINKDVNQMGPDEAVNHPESESCVSCKFNQWGSSPNGGKGKACRNQVRLAVVPPNFDPEDPDENEPMLVTMSPTALKSWTSVVTELSGMGKLPVEAVIEISFDPVTTYPTLRFALAGMLNDEQLAAAWALRSKAQVMLHADPSQED